jgi:hypothetical protein
MSIQDPGLPALVSIRLRSGKVIKDVEWSAVSADWVVDAVPWRTFRWYQGQRHYSGFYWSATMRDLVVYESRLELARLLCADFDPVVREIFAQPFLLEARIEGRVRRHVPDFLLVTDAGPVVVDVKPARLLERGEVAFTLGWTARAAARRGWEYEVFTGVPVARLENIRFLAGYRRTELIDPDVVRELRALDLAGGTLGQGFAALPAHPGALVRAAVLHLLWCGELTVDLDRPLSGSCIVGGAR